MNAASRNILAPLSIIYGEAVSIRNFGYDNGLLKVRRLPVPVVSVGNISVGGSGKTPFVMYLAEKLLVMGRQPAILSRGYKRMTKDLVVACPERGFDPDVRLVGDEPALMSRALPQIPVAVHADRHRAGLAVLDKLGADVFILDDGFQHRELHRDVDFVLMNRSLSDLTGSYLPAGNLRDSKRRLREAEVVILTAHEPFDHEAGYTEAMKKFTDSPAAGISFEPSEFHDHAGGHIPLEFLHGKNAAAFCGIANAGPFFESVEALAGKPVSRKEFGDHHWYDEYDIDEIFAGDEEKIAVTTSKDAIRIFADEELSQLEDIRRIYALAEKAVVNFGEEYIDNALHRIFEGVHA
jgi:tetraacyldisaccharide 4'-kinase